MIGNDVVDLRDRDARPETLHPRFDARVFSPAERLALERSEDPDRQRWRLWSAKEAAYKLARKLDPSSTFSPSRFEVELDRDSRGTVCYRGRRIAVRVLEQEHHGQNEREGRPSCNNEALSVGHLRSSY